MSQSISLSVIGDKTPQGFRFHLKDCASACTPALLVRRHDLHRQIAIFRECLADLVSQEAAIDVQLLLREELDFHFSSPTRTS